MTPWEKPPAAPKPPELPPWHPNTWLTKDPATGLWSGQRDATDIPDFLRRNPK